MASEEYFGSFGFSKVQKIKKLKTDTNFSKFCLFERNTTKSDNNVNVNITSVHL